MLRWLFAVCCVASLACSSTSTNEGSGGSAGAASGGGGAGGSAGAPSGGGGGGGILSCPWAECLKAVNNSTCKPLAVDCVGPVACKGVEEYATCACKGITACPYPTDQAGSELIECIATTPALAPLCLGLPGCTPAGISCVGKPETCCPGTTCDGNVCL